MTETALNLRKFVAPEIIFGEGAHTLAGQYMQKIGGSSVLVVSDPGVVKAGWCQKVTDSITQLGIQCCQFTAVSPNPKESEVMAGVEVYHENRCDSIIAIGGGSPMDCAKGIGIVVSNKQHILAFEGVDQISVPMPPLVCIPTTGGTSADVSQFCIINDTSRKTKIAIISKAIVPDLALIDPELLTTMDSYLTACTGLDALVHAIEAFVSNASSQLTDLHALEGIRLVSKYLLPSIQEPHNIVYREKIMLASLEAGLAFSNASLGAVHAMAHSLGGFLDLPHGECNAMLLNHVFGYNFKAEPDKFRKIGQVMGLNLKGMKENNIKKTISNAIDDLRFKVGVKDALGKKGLKTADIPTLAERAVSDPCLLTNPRKATRRDLEVIYEEAR